MQALLHTWDESYVAGALASGELDRTTSGVTPLWHAVYFGKAAWVERLIESGADLDAHDPDRIDREARQTQVVSIWHGPRKGHDVPAGRSTLLHAAVARTGDREVIRMLLAHVPVDRRDRYSDTPLHIAAFRKDLDVMTQLLDAGADINARDHTGAMPLDLCSLDLRAVELLLARGADATGGGQVFYNTTVTAAAYNNRVDILERLLAAGADLERHREALPLAAKYGAADAVRLLVEAGAALDATTEWRGKPRTPLPAAAMYAHRACAEALSSACRDQLDEALRTAIELASDDTPDPPNNRGQAREAVVAYLIEQGANVNAVDEHGETALLIAARLGHRSLTQLLLKSGADPAIRAANNKSAYEVAEHAYKHGIDDARFIMSMIAEKAARPPRPAVLRRAARKPNAD